MRISQAQFDAHLARVKSGGGAVAPAAETKARARRFHGDASRAKAWRLSMMALPGVFLAVRTFTESNAKGGWVAKWKRAQQQLEQGRGVAMVLNQRRRIELPAVVTFTRYSPQLMDDDNLPTAFKHVRDGIAKFVGVDDGDARWHWVYRQERARHHGIRVEIEPAAAEGGVA